MSLPQLRDLFVALKANDSLLELNLANCMINDVAAPELVEAIEANKCLEKLNLESNSITPQTLVKIFEVSFGIWLFWVLACFNVISSVQKYDS